MPWTSPQSRPNYPLPKTAAEYVLARKLHGKQSRRGLYFSERHRRVVILRLVGCSLTVIGGALGMSRQAAHSHLTRRGKISRRENSFWISDDALTVLGIGPALCEFLGAVRCGDGYKRKLRGAP